MPSVLDIVHDKLARNASTLGIPMARIFKGKAPQGQDMAHIVISVAAGDDQQMLAGAGQMYTHRVQIDANANDFDTATILADAILAVLQAHNKRATPILNCSVDFRQDGTEVSEPNDAPAFDRYIRGYYVDWQPNS